MRCRSENRGSVWLPMTPNEGGEREFHDVLASDDDGLLTTKKKKTEERVMCLQLFTIN